MSAMQRFAAAVVALLVASAVYGDSPSDKLPDDVFAQAPGNDTVDVLLIGSGRAAVVRLHVKIGPKSFQTAWGDFVIKLHAFLDCDGNGIVTTGEANRAPWTNLLNNPLNGGARIRAGKRPTAIDAKPKDGTVTFNELVGYLQGTQDFEPLGVESGPPADPRTSAVFTLLDRDNDGIITPAELTGTDGLVTKFDSDEDEVLSLEELTPDRSPLADRFRGFNPGGSPFDASKSSAFPLNSSEARTTAIRQLRSALKKPAPAKLGPEAFGVTTNEIASADRDQDGLLDPTELAVYLESPSPSLEILITLGRTRSASARVEKMPPRDKSAPAPALTTRSGTSGGLIVDVAGSEFEFVALESQNNVVGFLENQFKNADVNNDSVIDAKEARGNAFLQQIHSVADRNSDGKMTQSELKAYVVLSAAAEEARIALTVSDQGVPLHERLDADHDGRLSLRELRGSQAKMAEFDIDHDGRFSLSELPRRTQVNIGRGPTQNRNRVVAVARSGMVTPGAKRNGPALPAWFVGMDRNRDGDVSPREFLGPADEFRRFDADGDGLIDGTEATRVQ